MTAELTPALFPSWSSFLRSDKLSCRRRSSFLNIRPPRLSHSRISS